MAESSAPRVQIQIKIGTLRADVMALADTGYSGGVVIPEIERDKLDTRDGFTNLRLANEDRIPVELFQAIVDLKNRQLVVRAVVIGREFIIGREVLDHYRVCFDHGKNVEIED